MLEKSKLSQSSKWKSVIIKILPVSQVANTVASASDADDATGTIPYLYQIWATDDGARERIRLLLAGQRPDGDLKISLLNVSAVMIQREKNHGVASAAFCPDCCGRVMQG